MAIGDEEAEIAGASLVHARIVDFVENAMTQREPNTTVQVQGGAYAGLGTRRPAGLDAGPTWGIADIVTHGYSSSPSSSVPEDANRCSKFQR